MTKQRIDFIDPISKDSLDGKNENFEAIGNRYLVSFLIIITILRAFTASDAFQ